MYYVADIALISPLRDGMNLVAKEYVAAKCGHPGVLIRSEMAGAAVELKDAIQSNPNDKERPKKIKGHVYNECKPFYPYKLSINGLPTSSTD